MNDNEDDIYLGDINIVGSSTTDTISITDPYSLNMANIGTITLNSGGTGYSGATYTTSTTGTGAYLTSNGTYPNWTTSPSTIITTNTTSGLTPGITVKGDADFEGDIKIDGVSLRDTIKAITDRLAILVPDPKKLEKFEALQKAYKHYKLLEALCEEDEQKES